MTDSRFKSLAIGDRVNAFDLNRIVSNQYIKLNKQGNPVSYIEVPSNPQGAYASVPLALSEHEADLVSYLGGPR